MLLALLALVLIGGNGGNNTQVPQLRDTERSLAPVVPEVRESSINGGAIGPPVPWPAGAFVRAPDATPGTAPVRDEPRAQPQDAPQTAADGDPAGAPAYIVSLVCSYPWPCLEALSVMACESGGNPDAWNSWTSTVDPSDGVAGLYQEAIPLHQGLLDVYGGDPFNPETNVAVAYDLWSGSGGSWYPHWAAACRP